MSRHHRHRNGRGFVTLIAMGVLALIAALSAALVGLAGTQQQRTVDQAFAAQQRQLLEAGAAAAPRYVANFQVGDQDRTRSVFVPEELARRKAIVTLWVEQTIPNVERIAHVEVSLEGRPRTQALRFVRDRQGWGLVEAKLGG